MAYSPSPPPPRHRACRHTHVMTLVFRPLPPPGLYDDHGGTMLLLPRFLHPPPRLPANHPRRVLILDVSNASFPSSSSVSLPPMSGCGDRRQGVEAARQAGLHHRWRLSVAPKPGKCTGVVIGLIVDGSVAQKRVGTSQRKMSVDQLCS